MKRKMLISITLVTIMLLNCILPVFRVNAAESEEIVLNSKLYTAIMKSLKEQKIEADGDDVTHKLVLNESLIASVKELRLNEGGISDLTGIDKFTALERLELSGNELDKNSNLGVLNNLTNLKELDLSTNKLDDVSEISDLIDNLKENGKIILSSQTVKVVSTVFVDNDEESNNETTHEFDLPGILNLAGYIKSAWKTETRYSQAVRPSVSDSFTPSIKAMPEIVTPEDSKITINIANDSGSAYKGLVKLYICIEDDYTEQRNPNNLNRASENILNGSKFYLYFIAS